MYVEPNSDVRQIANFYRSLFNAHVEAGFTEDQAFEIVKIAETEMYKSSARES